MPNKAEYEKWLNCLYGKQTAYIDTNSIPANTTAGKNYEIKFYDGKSLILGGVETIKFNNASQLLCFYDAEGNNLAGFKRDSYEYYCVV